MRLNKFISAAIIALFLFTAGAHAQQLKTPAPSPTQTIDQAFALSNIKIEYSRPSVKGRIIYGDLVPYGKLWRTGANSATKITFGDDVKINGKPLLAGTYAVYTLPGRDSWDIYFNRDLSRGGDVAGYKQEEEALKIQATPTTLPNMVETFTINIADMTASTATIELLWEKTRVPIFVTADFDEKVMKNIEAALEKDSRPYFQAANYYYENNKDLATALNWVNLAIEQNPKAFWMVHLKAKIYKKMNDPKNAIAAAEESMKIAKEAGSDDYVRLNEKLIADAKKGN